MVCHKWLITIPLPHPFLFDNDVISLQGVARETDCEYVGRVDIHVVGCIPVVVNPSS